MERAGFTALLLAAMTAGSTLALAEDSPSSSSSQDQQSFTALVDKGFEVKAVMLVPLDVAKRATKSVTTDTVIVTLQNQKSVAVCYIAFANWAFMNKTSLSTPTLCEVR